MKSQWFKNGSGTVVHSTRRAVAATVPAPFLSKVLSLFVMVVCAVPASGQQETALPTGKEFTNSIGMKFVRIEAGRFRMGSEEAELPPAVLEAKETGGGTVWLPSKGDYDERPAHVVSISKPIHMAGFEVTNQVEEFLRPLHPLASVIPVNVFPLGRDDGHGLRGGGAPEVEEREGIADLASR